MGEALEDFCSVVGFTDSPLARSCGCDCQPGGSSQRVLGLTLPVRAGDLILRQCKVVDARLFRFVTFSVEDQNVIGWLIKLKSTFQHQCRIRAKQSRHNDRITTDRVAAAIRKG